MLQCLGNKLLREVNKLEGNPWIVEKYTQMLNGLFTKLNNLRSRQQNGCKLQYHKSMVTMDDLNCSDHDLGSTIKSQEMTIEVPQEF
jgi:hypothetical protein